MTVATVTITLLAPNDAFDGPVPCGGTDTIGFVSGSCDVVYDDTYPFNDARCVVPNKLLAACEGVKAYFGARTYQLDDGLGGGPVAPDVFFLAASGGASPGKGVQREME